MQGLRDNYPLHVLVASIFASIMILVSSNGVAEDVKVTTKGKVTTEVKITEASSNGSLKQPLAPPGPFGQSDSHDMKGLGSTQHAEQLTPPTNTLVAPKAPSMPNFKHTQNTPPTEISAPVMLQPANKGVTQSVKIKEPGFTRNKPSISQAIPVIKNPVRPAVPHLPPQPLNKRAPSIAMPAFGTVAPQFNHNIPPQHIMPQFSGHPGQLRAAPQIQQFRYIPLPVYQANYGRHQQPQPPSFINNMPGHWAPQMNNK